jgi:hypothetical protein
MCAGRTKMVTESLSRASLQRRSEVPTRGGCQISRPDSPALQHRRVAHKRRTGGHPQGRIDGGPWRWPPE